MAQILHEGKWPAAYLMTFSKPEKSQYIFFCFRSSFPHSTLRVFMCAHYTSLTRGCHPPSRRDC